MNEHDFIVKLIEVMDTEAELHMDSILENIEEWDSLSYVAFLALCAQVSKTPVKPQEVRDAKTVQDLFHIINR